MKEYDYSEMADIMYNKLADGNLRINDFGKRSLIDELFYNHEQFDHDPSDQMDHIILGIPDGTRDDYFDGVEIEDDEQISLAAVQAYGYLLNNVSDRLKNDPSFLAKALETQPDAVDHLPEDLKHEIGNNDPIKYLKAKANLQKLELSQNQQVEKKAEVAPKIKM